MNKPITALVVDDERFSREELIYLLEQHDSIKVIGEADSGDTALMKAIQTQPDVMFLDIDMPKMDGMEVAKSVQELKKAPQVVFATAYPEYAVEAFRHEALDYLLKPFDDEQLGETVKRIKSRFTNKRTPIKTTSPLKLPIESEDGIVYISPNDILYVGREERDTQIVTQNRVYETKLPLKEVEERLQDFTFFRIHKSYLVNLNHIKRLTPWFNGAYQLELQGVNEKLSVSRNYIKELRKQLEL
ncbi:LytR/AlgR family response regulator transcription factor [Pontibacillus marinus]|uniref:Regulator n=1 Tax=Pontibacillus marinus BH030004 = DSM 16465 TaxID=1385511 RepID=A0A0A5I482_9BACI|nr:LytTR family DNA-binding domain-containing protein [Pontibacillus marinus]KGX90637.1 regulator [Pontibacillus marinus BH030004 = DSM 16465]